MAPAWPNWRWWRRWGASPPDGGGRTLAPAGPPPGVRGYWFRGLTVPDEYADDPGRAGARPQQLNRRTDKGDHGWPHRRWRSCQGAGRSLQHGQPPRARREGCD